MKEKIITLLEKETSLSKVEIQDLLEIPPNPELGDYAFPCFQIAKKLKKNPNEIAKSLASKISPGKEIDTIKPAGPYINFTINKKILAKITLKQIYKLQDKFGSSELKKEKIMIEFSQPNTHKAFHIGHVRGTSIGESLSRLAEFTGSTVIRANYSGDTGMHIAKWLWNYLENHKNEKPKTDETWIAHIYSEAVIKSKDNPTAEEEIKEINRRIESKQDPKINSIWKETRSASINAWKKIYKELNTKFDVHFFESTLEAKGKDISNTLLKKGIAEKSEGATIINLEKFKLGVWILLRNDGTVLYSAKDLALAKEKFQKYKLDSSIVITDSSQNLHFKQLIKTLHLMNFKNKGEYKHFSYNPVRLPSGKMSSRTGENILYSDFKQELTSSIKKEINKKSTQKASENRVTAIAIASLKYAMLKQDSNKVIVFNKDEALRFEGNTGPYLLYTYARAKSILRKSKQKPNAKISSLNDNEKKLVIRLSNFSGIVTKAHLNHAPNLIANYAYELAQTFNEYYQSTKIIGSEQEPFKLSLVSAVTIVLKNALYLLGIEAIEIM